MNTIDQQRKQVAAEIESLSRQIDEMDGRIRAYLADRQNKPHPRHLDLIEKIQNYRLDPNIATKHLNNMVDNMQWKVYYSKKVWKQLWENAEERRRVQMPQAPAFIESTPDTNDSGEANPSKGHYSVDTLWEIQKEKIRVYGNSDIKESKSEFKKRMIKEYQQLIKHKKADQEIVLTFDKKSKHCKLDLK